MVPRTTDAPVPLGQYVPTADSVIVMRGTWGAYEHLLALRGEHGRPKLAYLDGVIELMSPSKHHESIKSGIGSLVETFCSERELPWQAYGEWTQKDPAREAGLEPDECYVFDRDPDRKPRPDLAIEVVWTRGGLEKLEIYRRLGIPEVWFWEDDEILVFVLGATGYEQRAASSCLPAIDLVLVCRMVAIKPTSDAVAQFRAALRGG